MKKNMLAKFIKIMSILFVIGTISILLMVYMNIDNFLSDKFFIGYIVVLFALLFSMILMILLNSKKLGWVGIKKRLPKFFAIAILLNITFYIIDYVFGTSGAGWFRGFSLAFALSFVDLVFYDNSKN